VSPIRGADDGRTFVAVDREQAIANFQSPISGPATIDFGNKPGPVLGPDNPPRRLGRAVVSDQYEDRYYDGEREQHASRNHDPEERRPAPARCQWQVWGLYARDAALTAMEEILLSVITSDTTSSLDANRSKVDLEDAGVAEIVTSWVEHQLPLRRRYRPPLARRG
jgi:hypothetical protein